MHDYILVYLQCDKITNGKPMVHIGRTLLPMNDYQSTHTQPLLPSPPTTIPQGG